MQQSIIVTGASSQLGVFLLPRLAAAGWRVTALSRKAPTTPIEAAPGIRWAQPDYLLARCQSAGGSEFSANFLVSCAPLDLAGRLVRACPDIERVVAFSTSSVLSKAESADRAENELVTGIAMQEKELRKRCGQQGIPLLILRPTLIYGCGMDRNVSLLAQMGRRFGFVPLAGSATGLRQPVHADDLAGLAVSALRSGHPLDFDSPACGGSTLTYRDMARKAMAGLTGRSRSVPVPAGMLATLVRMLSAVGPWRGLNAEMVHRQGRDLVFDDSVLRSALNYNPRPFKPSPADFEIPPAAKPLQLPR